MILELLKCKHGFFFFPSSDDIVGRSLRAYGEYSEAEVDVFAQILRPGDLALDVGANIGSLAIPMARMVGREGKVFAFEPQFVLAQLIAASAAVSSVNIKVFNAAVGAEKKMVAIPDFGDYEMQYNYGRVEVGEVGYKNLMVPQLRLDDVTFPGPIRFAKIDAEGMEGEVLRGAHELILRDLPILFVENDRKNKALELLATIRDLNYTPFWHISPLFNPDNFRKKAENIFNTQGSFNMLCSPKEGPNVLDLEGLVEATEENTKIIMENSLYG